MPTSEQTELPVETDPADNKLPAIKPERLQKSLRELLDAVGAKPGSVKARHLEGAFLHGHELTHRLNPHVVLLFQEGRSILDL